MNLGEALQGARRIQYLPYGGVLDVIVTWSDGTSANVGWVTPSEHGGWISQMGHTGPTREEAAAPLILGYEEAYGRRRGCSRPSRRTRCGRRAPRSPRSWPG